MRAFIIFEPPVVAPRLYRELPAITSVFKAVYVHNTEGDGYSLKGVDQSVLRKLYWPQPKAGIIENLWHNRERQRRIVVINGNHRAVSTSGELYSKRIEVMADLAVFGVVDLYGQGWERWWSRNSMWLPYWRNRPVLMSIYRGGCASKYEVLSKYEFALCFENMSMKGYVTEKIFDCLFAGTIPVYLGATDVSDLIPEECYVDYRNYPSGKQLWRHLQSLSQADIELMREAGRNFVEHAVYAKYYNFLQDVVAEGR